MQRMAHLGSKTLADHRPPMAKPKFKTLATHRPPTGVTNAELQRVLQVGEASFEFTTLTYIILQGSCEL